MIKGEGRIFQNINHNIQEKSTQSGLTNIISYHNNSNKVYFFGFRYISFDNNETI